MTVENVRKTHENEEKRQYHKRINIDHWPFTTLVFSLTGGIRTEGSMFYKHIAERNYIKTEKCYEEILPIIRCKLSILILRSCLMYITGSHSHRAVKESDDFEIAFEELKYV